MLGRLTSSLVTAMMSLFVVSSLAGYDVQSPPEPSPSMTPWIETSDRETVAAVYADVFSRSTPSLDWTGRTEDCVPGDSSDALRDETLFRVAYYRAMAGVPAVVTEDPEMSRQAQAAALMMSVEGELTHHPDEAFACFSTDGRHAAANSNLYLGRTGPAAIDGYIEDPGDGNVDVGHRNTILHPPTRQMGIGHVAGSHDRYPANALWVFDDRVFVDDAKTREASGFVAWPPRGFVPAEVVYPRWSFALSRADFSNAEISMTLDGVEVDLDVVARLSKNGEIPSSVIVWEPDIELAPGPTDRTYTVTVSEVGPPPARSLLASDEIGSIGARRPTATTTFSYQVTVMGTSDRTPSPLRALLAPATRAALATLEPMAPF